MHIQYGAYSNDVPAYSWPAVNEDRPLEYLQLTNTQLWSGRARFSADYMEQAQAVQRTGLGHLISATPHSRYQLREFMADFWLNHSASITTRTTKSEPAWSPMTAMSSVRMCSAIFATFWNPLPRRGDVALPRQRQQRAAQPNENYARELMELHTMGAPPTWAKSRPRPT